LSDIGDHPRDLRQSREIELLHVDVVLAEGLDWCVASRVPHREPALAHCLLIEIHHVEAIRSFRCSRESYDGTLEVVRKRGRTTPKRQRVAGRLEQRSRRRQRSRGRRAPALVPTSRARSFERARTWSGFEVADDS
jgi:hypothetical protein